MTYQEFGKKGGGANVLRLITFHCVLSLSIDWTPF
jgi:hypothetical protein